MKAMNQYSSLFKTSTKSNNFYFFLLVFLSDNFAVCNVSKNIRRTELERFKLVTPLMYKKNTMLLYFLYFPSDSVGSSVLSAASALAITAFPLWCLVSMILSATWWRRPDQTTRLNSRRLSTTSCLFNITYSDRMNLVRWGTVICAFIAILRIKIGCKGLEKRQIQISIFH